MQIDVRELLAIDPSARSRPRRLDAVSEQHERLPGGPDGALVLAGRAAEGVPVGAKESAPLQELRKPTARLKWNATRFRVLGVLGGDTDLVRVPDHVTVLDLQHLTETATGLQRADDSIPHCGTGEAMLSAVEFIRRAKQP